MTGRVVIVVLSSRDNIVLNSTIPIFLMRVKLGSGVSFEVLLNI